MLLNNKVKLNIRYRPEQKSDIASQDRQYWFGAPEHYTRWPKKLHSLRFYHVPLAVWWFLLVNCSRIHHVQSRIYKPVTGKQLVFFLPINRLVSPNTATCLDKNRRGSLLSRLGNTTAFKISSKVESKSKACSSIISALLKLCKTFSDSSNRRCSDVFCVAALKKLSVTEATNREADTSNNNG